MQRLLFIINPAAGQGSVKLSRDSISKSLDPDKFTFEIAYTEAHKRADEITRNMRKDFDVFIAVGGDGTINEIAREIVGTEKVLGIIPRGSGNGLARSLGIPMKVPGAVGVINNFKVTKIDAVTINEQYFFNVAGVGFDAYVAKLFDGKEKRGLQGYVKVIAKKFFKYQGKEFAWQTNGHAHSEKAFLMSFANTSQFGNNAYIAPAALYDDGKFDFCLLRDFPRWKTPGLAFKLFNKTLDKSSYYFSESLEKLSLRSQGEIWAHLDGEPVIFQDDLEIKIKPGALRVIGN